MQTLLVATDFSAPASNAVMYAASLAQYFNARLILVNAYPMPVAGDPQIPIVFSVVIDASEKALEEIKNNLRRTGFGPEIQCYSAMGPAYHVIENACQRFKAEMVILGMTGEAGKLKEHLIGSTAVSVGRDLKIPALIIPDGVGYKRIHHISFACDADKLEENALMYSARYFSILFDATLELVTVQKGEDSTKWHTPGNYSFTEKKLSAIRYRQVFLKDEHVATALEYYFKFHETDLILVNPGKHSLFERLFGESVTKHLAFRSRVPLLLIH